MKNTRTKRVLSQSALLIALILLFCSVFSGLVGVSFTSATVAEAVVSEIDSYYSSLNENLTGTAFRSELADLITRTHTHETTYDGLRDVFKTTDADPNKPGNIIWFYTGTSVSFNGSFNSGTNREHVWPKNAGKAFPADSKAGSDAHHLRPANDQLNSTRGSLSFNEVPQTSNNIVKQNGSSSYGNLCYSGGGFFYPGEGYRGATARILMYVQVRWGDDYDLTFVDSAGNNKTIGKISTLMKWHLQEPPTEEEIRRNEAVADIQGNRNPFIDHPEYASKIFCYDGMSYNNTLQNVVNTYGDYGDDVDVESVSIDGGDRTLAVGEKVQLTATVTPSNASKSIEWLSIDNSVATISQTGEVTALKGGYTQIIAQSTKNPTIKATINLIVKTPTKIEISGTPLLTKYYEGEAFDPDGLSITVTYDDDSTGQVDPKNCKWLDGVTEKPTLSKGTTAVICDMGGVRATFAGIVVKAMTGGTITITRDNFTGSGGYAWSDWSATDSKNPNVKISGQGYIYPGEKNALQQNSSKTYRYIYNSTPIPGKIVSITVSIIEGKSNKTYEILTQSTPYDSTATPYPSTGTSHGEQTVTVEGTKWMLETSDQYFCINYTDTGATYIQSIVIQYGGEECQHVYGDWIEGTPATCQQNGSVGHYNCANCGENFDENKQPLDTIVIPKLAHTEGEWIIDAEATCSQAGSKHTECTVCHTTIKTESIAKLDHTESEWIIDEDATCTSDGIKHTECTVCHEEMQVELIDKLPHTPTDWIVDSAPTCIQLGHKHTECSVCHEQIDTAEIPMTNHTLGEWETILEPTTTACGKQKATCTVCHEYYEERSIAPIGHTEHTRETKVVTTDATCTRDGLRSTIVYCTVCEEVFERTDEVIPSVGHVFSTEWTVDVEPTCTAEGSKSHHCTVCDEAKRDITTIEMTPHTYGEWQVTTAPTVNSEGERTHRCTVCGHAEVESVPKLEEDFSSRFIQEVAEIANAQNNAQRFDAIKTALETYNQLTASQKASVASHYATLTTAIEQYNASVAVQNSAHQKANDVAFPLLASGIVALSALLLALRKRLI